MQENVIVNASCFEVLPLIPDGSIDLILTDPPYLTTSLAFDKTTIEWDLLFSELKRVLKLNGWFFMYGTLEMYKKASDYFREKFTYVWVKNNAVFSSNSLVAPNKKHEYIFAFIQKDLVKMSSLTFNKEALKTYGHKPYSCKKETTLNDEWSKSIGASGCKRPVVIDRTWRWGTTVLEHKIQQKYGHCTVKPLDQIETIIKGYSDENDLILDPFSGSGTTCLGAKKLNRRFIGIELEPKYVELSKKRFNDSGYNI